MLFFFERKKKKEHQVRQSQSATGSGKEVLTYARTSTRKATGQENAEGQEVELSVIVAEDRAKATVLARNSMATA